MIPHLSKLKNISNLNDFSQMYCFKKESTKIEIIPTIYDELNPYYNNVNNEYFMLMYCRELQSDINFKNFLTNFLTTNEITELNNYYVMAVFKIVNDEINLLGVKKIFSGNYLNFNHEIESKKNIILDGLNIIGINLNVDSYNYGSDENYVFGNEFRVNIVLSTDANTNNNINKHYRFPDSLTTTDFTTANCNAFYPHSSMFSLKDYNVDLTKSMTEANTYGNISYSSDGFQTKQIAYKYKNAYMDHFIPNVENSKYIAVAHQDYPFSVDMNLDIFKEGVIYKYLKKNVTSIQWIEGNIFQIVKNFILYECNLNLENGEFYNIVELENLNTYKAGKLKNHTNFIKIGSILLSEQFTPFQKSHHSSACYINGEKFSSNTIIYGEIGNYYIYPTYLYNTLLGFINMTSPRVYKFKSFIILPRNLTILPNQVLDNTYIKTINTSTNNMYISTRIEDSIIKIENIGDVTILENDATLISQTGDSAYYKVKSNIGFSSSNGLSLFNITNNVNDISGGMKNVLYDTTNSIIAKIDAYEYDKNWGKITYEINVDINDMKKYIMDENKFIEFIDPLDSYYISLNGYEFDSLADLKTNFFSVLQTHFSDDEIKISDFTTTNVNYIDDVIAIQTSLNKRLTAVYNGDGNLTLDYNFISLNKYFNTTTDHTTETSQFKIDHFIDSDGTVHSEESINYKLYNINLNTANTFKIVCTTNLNYSVDDRNNAVINVNYNMEELENITSYNNDKILSNIEITIDTTENIDVDVIDSTTLIFSNNVIDGTNYNSEILLNNIVLNNDEILNINIELTNSNINSNIHNEDIFSSYKNNDYFDLHITDENNYNVLHFDYIGKTFNKYNMLLPIHKNFYTFGMLPKKCKSLISLLYDYNEINTVNSFYGVASSGVFYNLMEQNSAKYFVPKLKSYASYTAPTSSNMICNGFNIKLYDTDTSYYSSEATLDIWPLERESHTLVSRLPMEYMADMKSSWYTSIYGMYIALYGTNYGAYINAPTTTSCNIGTSIRPPYVNENNTYCSANNYFMFNKHNSYGFDLLRYYDETTGSTDVHINDHNVSFIFNRYVDSTTYSMERVLFDTTDASGVDNIGTRLPTSSWAYPHKSKVDFCKPILYGMKSNNNYIDDVYNTKIPISYMTASAGNINSTVTGPKFNHIVDFDYELSTDELTYFNENMFDILTKMFIEKRKNGSDIVNGKFSYNYLTTGSYIYNISRSFINVKLIKKYGMVGIYVNNILIEEIITNSDTVDVSKILTYGNNWIGDKKITVTKLLNVITKKSGFWC